MMQTIYYDLRDIKGQQKEIRDKVAVKIMAVKGISRTITGVAAFEACYDGRCDDYADQALAYVEKLRDEVYDFFQKRIPQIKMLKPEATFVCWLDCRGLGMSHEDMMKFFTQVGTLMGNGLEYDAELGRGHVRMAYAFPRAQLMEALEKLASAVEKL